MQYLSRPSTAPSSPAEAAQRPGELDRLLDVRLFKALSDPTRVKLLACLARCGRGCAVTEVAACCSVDLSVVSRHLSHLEQAGLVEAQREGRSVRYAARSGSISAALRGLADAFDTCAEPAEGGACAGGAVEGDGHGCC